jgi:MFS transporter, PAT family, beta-lactamase induction signal transducer AmpG
MQISERRSASRQSAQPHAESPWLFGLLIAPMAVITNGILGGALSYMLRDQGVGPARGAGIVALLSLPSSIYFLWSPLTDFWIRRRSWLIVAAVVAALAMFAAFQSHSLAARSAEVLMFLSACLGQLIVAACGGMMGSLRTEVNRRRASSFYQGGSLAFGALAVLVFVPLSERLSPGKLGWIAAAMIALPSLAALAAPEQPGVSAANIPEKLAQIGREFKSTFLRWGAIPYTLVVLFPMGSGAMMGLLPGLAADYHVTGNQVAWINGVGGALLMAAGALSASLISTRVRAAVAYISAGIVNAGTLAVLWLGPLHPFVYVAGTVAFLFTTGACYAFFTAVVLTYLGGSGKSGSARYAIINSLGNVPVLYMMLLDGRGYAHWGPRGMPGTDTVVSAVGGAILLTYFLTRHGEQKLDGNRAEKPADILAH